MSNVFKLEHGTLKINPARSIPDLPLVKLGDQHFMKVTTMNYPFQLPLCSFLGRILCILFLHPLCSFCLSLFPLSPLPFLPQVSDFLARFENIPDMLEMDHLTVSGDVTFGKDVILKVIAVLFYVCSKGVISVS